MIDVFDRSAMVAEPAARAAGTVDRSIPFGIWTADATGNTTYLSPSFLALLDLSRGAWEGLGWTKRLLPGTAEPMLRRWRNCMYQVWDLWDAEFEVVGPDGRYAAVLSRGAPIRDGFGGVSYWSGVNLDITGRKEVERERDLLLRDHGETAPEPLTVGEIEVVPASFEARRNGEAVALTPVEFKLLEAFAAAPGRVLTREHLLHRVWGDGDTADKRAVDSYVRRLRKKLEPDASHPRRIQTVRGFGYRMVTD